MFIANPVVTTKLEHNSVIRPVNHQVRDGAEATFVAAQATVQQQSAEGLAPQQRRAAHALPPKKRRSSAVRPNRHQNRLPSCKKP